MCTKCYEPHDGPDFHRNFERYTAETNPMVFALETNILEKLINFSAAYADRDVAAGRRNADIDILLDNLPIEIRPVRNLENPVVRDPNAPANGHSNGNNS